MNTDSFSDILKFANTQSVVSGGLTAGGRWAIRFRPPGKIKFFAIVKGNCWLRIDGEEVPVRVESGDVFLVSQRPIVFASELTVAPIDATTLFAGNPNQIAKLGDGSDFFLLGGHVQLDPTSGGFLADVLPPLIHVRAASPQATVLQWLLDQLVRERRLNSRGPVSRRRSSPSSCSSRFCVRIWKHPVPWLPDGCARSATSASLQLCA